MELSLVLLLFIVNEVECTTGRGRNKIYKNSPPAQQQVETGLKLEIKFFLEANFVGGFRLNSPKRKSFMGLCRGAVSAIVAVETFDFHPFARFEYQHIRYEIVEQSRNKQGGKITIDDVPTEYFFENEQERHFH